MGSAFSFWHSRFNLRYRVLFEESNCIADGYNRLGTIVRNFATKFLFEIHYHFNLVKAVGVEIINEACTCHDLVGVYRKLLDYKFFDPFGDISHLRSPPVLYSLSGAFRVKAVGMRPEYHRGVAGLQLPMAWFVTTIYHTCGYFAVFFRTSAELYWPNR